MIRVRIRKAWHSAAMRIGTWNMEGKVPSPAQAALMEGADCDVWLLTEVHPDIDLGPEAHHVRSQTMTGTRDRAWAAVWSRTPLEREASPHPASAVAVTGGIRFCSSVLPWRSASTTWPDDGVDVGERTRAALARLAPVLTAGDRAIVWGGDWNHALEGPETAGSLAGRECILETLAAAGLTVPTAALPHRIPELRSIDHIAIPSGWRAGTAQRIVAQGADERRLSDHDAYVVEAWPG